MAPESKKPALQGGLVGGWLNDAFNLRKARFLSDPSVAALKVSFFGPFYGGYHVVSLDDQYQTSWVIGNSLDYFWLLSRSKSIPEQQFRRLLDKAQSQGVDLSQVQVVPQ